MRIRHFFSAALLAMSVTLGAGIALADVSGAQDFVTREHGDLKKLVDGNASQEAVRAKIDGMVDYDELTNRTLGSPCPVGVPGCTNWKAKLNDEQYKNVRDRLRKLVEKNYNKNLHKTRDYDVTYRGGKEMSEQNLAKIRTEAKSKTKPRDPAVQVDYMIMSHGDKYSVIDIITEGSSMTKNYYDQFNRMLTNTNQGYPYLIERLDKTIAKQGASGDRPVD